MTTEPECKQVDGVWYRQAEDGKWYRDPALNAPPLDAKTITWLRHLFPNWGRAQ